MRILFFHLWILLFLHGTISLSCLAASSAKSSKKTVKSTSSKKLKLKKKKSSYSPRTPRVKVNPSRPPMAPPPFSEGSKDIIYTASPAFTDFDLPTDNQAVFGKVNPASFFQPTFSGRTISATYGFVRNPGTGGKFTRFHEGVDIRPLQRDSDGEPADEVRAAANGTVVYVCRSDRDSNYGRYVVIQHDLFGSPFYTLYAHLASVPDEINPGVAVTRSQEIAILGRTSNEFDIQLDYAHLHFEVDLMANDRYIEWSMKRGEGQPQHGLYNGSNLIGVDPIRFLQFLQVNPDLGIGDFVRREPAAFRVLVPEIKDFSWIERYPFSLTKPMTSSTCAYEIAMTYYGLPVQVIPKSRDEISKTAWRALNSGLYPLTYASSTQLHAYPAQKFLENRGKRWLLNSKGKAWINQLLYH